MWNIVTRSYGVAGRKSCVQAMLLQWWTIKYQCLYFLNNMTSVPEIYLILSCLVSLFFPFFMLFFKVRIHNVSNFIRDSFSVHLLQHKRAYAASGHLRDDQRVHGPTHLPSLHHLGFQLGPDRRQSTNHDPANLSFGQDLHHGEQRPCRGLLGCKDETAKKQSGF